MREELTRIYIKYKRQVVPIVLIAISLFIIFRVIIPQFSSISETNREIEEKEREVENLRQTLSSLQNSNREQTESTLALVSKALPDSKDISIIFSAISGAASASNVELRDFSLRIGGIYGRAAAGSTVRGVPLVDVTINLSSPDPDNYIAFSNEIQTRLPLTEIKSLSTSNERGTFELGFYYKPLDLALISRQAKVEPLSNAQLNLIEQLREWDK